MKFLQLYAIIVFGTFSAFNSRADHTVSVSTAQCVGAALVTGAVVYVGTYFYNAYLAKDTDETIRPLPVAIGAVTSVMLGVVLLSCFFSSEVEHNHQIAKDPELYAKLDDILGRIKTLDSTAFTTIENMSKKNRLLMELYKEEKNKENV